MNLENGIHTILEVDIVLKYSLFLCVLTFIHNPTQILGLSIHNCFDKLLLIYAQFRHLEVIFTGNVKTINKARPLS